MCPYGILFGGKACCPNPVIANIRPDIPSPWVLQPPEGGAFRSGQRFVLDITLLGDTVYLADSVIRAFCLAGSIGVGRTTGQFMVEEVTQPWINSGPLFHSGRLKKLPKPIHWIEEANIEEEAKAAIVSFLTPLRLRSTGRYIREAPDFRTVVESISRRIESIAVWHQGIPLQESPSREVFCISESISIIRSDVSWTDATRISRNQGYLRYGGLLGWVEYGGPINNLLLFLRAAKISNIGKGSTMGFGRISVDR